MSAALYPSVVLPQDLFEFADVLYAAIKEKVTSPGWLSSSPIQGV